MLPTNTHILFPEFEYHAPTTVYEATELLAHYGDDARLMAGGTDLLVQMKMERRQPAHVISLERINALHDISQNGHLTIGAATSIRNLHQFLSFNLHEPPFWFATVIMRTESPHEVHEGGEKQSRSTRPPPATCGRMNWADSRAVRGS